MIPEPFLAALLLNLRNGFRLFTLRLPRAEPFVVGFDQAVALGLLTLASALLFDWLHAEADSELFVFGLLSWGFCFSLGLLAALLVARAQGPDPNILALLVPVLAVAPLAIGLIWAVDQLGSPHMSERAIRLICLAIVTLYISMALRAAYSPTKLATRIAAVVAILTIAWIGTNAYFLQPTLWEAPYDDELETGGQEPEVLLYAQAAKIASTVAQVAPGQPGTEDVFFVGFAGDGYQRVFRREALFARDAFAKRYQSGDRSLELINDNRDEDSYPLATVVGMRDALKRLGARMNLDEDVLVLMLTSHGSSDGDLAVAMSTAPLTQLRAEDVRSALDDAGIQWRVVIVSACYAGTFVEPLKSPRTVVITAADAVHNSFGCADDRDLTYFGEAFLRDALPGAASLQAAFEKARDLIREREAAEGKDHSNPQLYVGAEIAPKLARLDAARPAD